MRSSCTPRLSSQVNLSARLCSQVAHTIILQHTRMAAVQALSKHAVVQLQMQSSRHNKNSCQFRGRESWFGRVHPRIENGSNQTYHGLLPHKLTLTTQTYPDPGLLPHPSSEQISNSLNSTASHKPILYSRYNEEYTTDCVQAKDSCQQTDPLLC